MAITLPTEKIPAEMKSPGRLVIYSPPKSGKTTAVAMLDDCLILDTERGSRAVEALKIEVHSCDDIFAVCEEIKKRGKLYKYIAVDTITGLETMCIPLALRIYNQTPMGKNYTGNVLNLPNGAGYLYLRQAFDIVLDMIQSSCERLILLGHLKDKFIEKAGKEVSAKDLDLTGRIKSITCAYADAIGYLSKRDGEVTVSFKGTDDVLCGARPVHLRDQEIVLSKEIEPGQIRTFWERIYID